MIYLELTAKRDRYRDTPGKCAKCGGEVWESLATLDDAYNVWAGICPHCKAINLLSMNFGIRGYCSSKMELVLPTDEEKKANEMPADCPTSGPSGPADMHGSNLGELCHKIMSADEKP